MDQMSLPNFWKQYQLYSIDLDSSMMYDAEKITFHDENLKKILSYYQQKQEVITYGCFGDHLSVAAQINKFYDGKIFSFDERMLDKEKGKILVVNDDQVLIFCLIVPLQYLITKPLNEKSLEITLFRILQDLSQTIVACLNKEILKDWYIGENIPFYERPGKKINVFQIVENEQLIIKTDFQQLQLLVDSYEGWNTLCYQDNSPYILLFRKKELDQQEIFEFQKQSFNLLIQITLLSFKYKKCELQISMNKYLPQIYQSPKVVLKIVEFYDYVKTQTDKIFSMLQQKLEDCCNGWFSSTNINQFLNHFNDNLDFLNGKFSLSIKLSETSKKYSKEFVEIEKIILQNLQDLYQNTIQHYIEQLKKEMQEDQKQNQNIVFQRCIFSTIRELDKDNNLQKITLAPCLNHFYIEASKIYNNQELQKGPIDAIEPLTVFKTANDACDILILQKQLCYIAFLILNNGSVKKITNFEKISFPCFLYIQQSETLYCFNHLKGNIAKIVIDNSGKILSDDIFYDRQLNQVMKQVVYLSYNQSFIGLNEKGEILKWSENQEQFEKIKCLQINTKNSTTNQIEFTPTKQSNQAYSRIWACPHGKLFFLSNGSVIDTYDLNYERIFSIELKGKIKMFNDSFDFFSIALENRFEEKIYKNKKVLILKNLSNQRRIKQLNEQVLQQKKEGNPFLDIMKASHVKYGPISNFLHIKGNSKINIYLMNHCNQQDTIKKYLKVRDLDETCVFQFSNDNECKLALQKEVYDIKLILKIAFSRVPLQLCTIENNQLIPLMKGFRMQINQQQQIAILQRAKLLTLGFIEDHLQNINEKIYVISIIGRQSSGKSYLLNRIFGTRFSVAASRCTDGIWASVAQIYDSTFLVLDCEGLFSRQRTASEETQLLAFLAGVCDLTILNQDLSFNRYLDDLLNNLTNVIGKVKGETLFKGSLLIALRDVSSKDNGGAEEELLKGIIDTNRRSQKNSNFMRTLFNDQFQTQQFQNFEHIHFSSTIENVRESFIGYQQTSNHWTLGKDLIQTMKILLIQLETKDDESTDSIHQKMQVDEIVEKSLSNWITYGTELEFEFQGQQFFNNQYSLWPFNQGQSDFQNFCQTLLKQIYQDLKLKQDIKSHNQNLMNIQNFLNILVKQRKSNIAKEFEKQLEHIMKKAELKEFIHKERIQFFRVIEEQESQYQLCLIQCSQCNLNCSRMSVHSRLLQNQINEKDLKLKEIQKKIDSTISTSDLLKQIDLYRKQLQQMNQQMDEKQQEISYIRIYLENIELKQEKNQLLEKAKKDGLVEKEDFVNINNQPLLQKLGKLEEYQTSNEDNFLIQITKSPNTIENLKIIFQQQENKLIEIFNNVKEQLDQQLKLVQHYELQEKQLKEENVMKTSELNQKRKLISNLQLEYIEIERRIHEFCYQSMDASFIEKQISANFEFCVSHSKHQSLKQSIMNDDQKIVKKLEEFSNIKDLDMKKLSYFLSEIKLMENRNPSFIRIVEFIKKNQEEIENEILEIVQFINTIEEIEPKEQLISKYITDTKKKNEDLQYIANEKKSEQLIVEINYQNQIQKREEIQKYKQNSELLNEYQSKIRQQKDLQDKQQKLNQLKTKIKAKETQRFNRPDLENQFKELNLTFSSEIDTNLKAYQHIQKYIQSIEQNIENFERENSDLDIAKYILGDVLATQTQERILFKQYFLAELKKTQEQKFQEEVSQIRNDLIYIFEEQVKNEIQLYQFQAICKCLQLRRQLLQNENQMKTVRRDLDLILGQKDNFIKETDPLKQVEIQFQTSLKKISQDREQQQQIYNKIEFELQKKNQLIDRIKQIKELLSDHEELQCQFKECCQKLVANQQNEQLLKQKVKGINLNDLPEENILKEQRKKNEEKLKLEENIKELVQKLKILENKTSDIKMAMDLAKELEDLKQEEKNQHSCLRESHLCDELCMICNKSTVKCQKKAGHQEDHLCNSKDHYCTQKCTIKNCKAPCTKKYSHDGEHSCSNFHSCAVACQWCGSNCQFDFSTNHEKHICSQKNCIQKCILCNRICNKGHEHTREPGDVHFCENPHSCNQKCSVLGVCSSAYEEEKRVWKTAISNFEYTYFKQIDGGKQPCTIEIKAGERTHSENHQCKKESHRCGVKCPECDGLCSKTYGHAGFHSAAQHRNKDNQIFTLASGQRNNIVIQENNLIIKRYQVGESSSPETCTDSCGRRLNSHFHLVRCQLGVNCLEKKGNRNARHQRTTYQGFESVQFDEVLCVEFWKIKQWEHPVQDGNKLANIERCNFYCSLCPQTNKQFCKNKAWHTQSNKYTDHEFQCKESHQKNVIVGLDVVFVLDVTGSMASYIQQSKTMIINIMNSAKNAESRALRFGIVGYRDHPPQDSSFVTKVQNLGNQDAALQFLNSLTADGGGDYPEAVLDGLQAAVNLAWIPQHNKMIFLIGDAPPHGNQYSNDSTWPDGCPCGINEKLLFSKMKELNIDFKILEIASGLNKMIDIFKSHISLEVITQGKDFDFVNQVVNRVCKQLEIIEITCSLQI